MPSFDLLLATKHRHFSELIYESAAVLDNGSEVFIPEWKTQELGDGSFKCDICGLASFHRVSETGRQGSKKKINVYVKGEMYAIKRNDEIVFQKYKTSVLYCRPEKPSSMQKLKDPVGYHYDFDSNVDPAHPVFHAQQDNSMLVDDVVEQFDSSFERAPTNGFGSARIPTCQLDFYCKRNSNHTYSVIV